MPFDGTDFKIAARTTTEPWRSALLNAADQIEAHGWAKYSNGVEGGRRCAYFSILDQKDGWCEAINKFQQYIGAECIVLWNDAANRTEPEVVDALRNCARQS